MHLDVKIQGFGKKIGHLIVNWHISSEKANKKYFLFTYTKSIHRKATGSYHMTIISLDSVHRCHHLFHKYSHQRNKKQNPYVFRLNHFFGLGTPTLWWQFHKW